MKIQSKTQEKKRAISSDRTDSAAEVSKISITVVGAFATIVGLWSLACIVGGIMSSGGVGELVSAWFSAVTGN